MTLHIDTAWRKSTFSAADANCVEIALGTWRKSTFSAEDANCVEFAHGSWCERGREADPVEVVRGAWCESTTAQVAAVRDSKNPGGPRMAVPEDAFRAFIAALG